MGKVGPKWRSLVVIAVIMGLIILVRALGLVQNFEALRDWIESGGIWAPLVFIGCYIVATVAAVPGVALSVAAGALFGSVLGVMVVITGATLGASAAFLISRYFARAVVEEWLSKSDKFRRLDELTEKHGAIMVALTRLVPLFPFNLLNYGFGLTRVPFWTYFFWSALCMLPATVLYVVGADALTRGITEGEISGGLIFVLVSAAAILVFLVRYARRRLKTDENAASARNISKG